MSDLVSTNIERRRGIRDLLATRQRGAENVAGIAGRARQSADRARQSRDDTIRQLMGIGGGLLSDSLNRKFEAGQQKERLGSAEEIAKLDREAQAQLPFLRSKAENEGLFDEIKRLFGSPDDPDGVKGYIQHQLDLRAAGRAGGEDEFTTRYWGGIEAAIEKLGPVSTWDLNNQDVVDNILETMVGSVANAPPGEQAALRAAWRAFLTPVPVAEGGGGDETRRRPLIQIRRTPEDERKGFGEGLGENLRQGVQIRRTDQIGEEQRNQDTLANAILTEIENLQDFPLEFNQEVGQAKEKAAAALAAGRQLTEEEMDQMENLLRRIMIAKEFRNLGNLAPR